MINEYILYGLARLFYHSEVAHNEEMKEALTSIETDNTYRRNEFQKIEEALHMYKIPVKNQTVLDFGCHDGAITTCYLNLGAKSVIGVDIDKKALERARKLRESEKVKFFLSTQTSTPLDDESIDVIVAYDVFEHITQPKEIVDEFYRILRVGGQVLIGTWGWGHPFAPHLWAIMPVPYSHIFVSEKTLLRACRRVYCSAWYRPVLIDFDEHGNRKKNKYEYEKITSLNKFFIADFERTFAESKFTYDLHLIPFGSKYASWTRIFLRNKFLREYVTSYLWVTLTKYDGN